MFNIALSGLETEAFLYVDNIYMYMIVVYATIITILLKYSKKSNLKLNTQKCKFLLKEFTYLVRFTTPEGVKPDPSKFEDIKNYSIPRNIDDVTCFVVSYIYCRRIKKNFAEIATHLKALLKKIPSSSDHTNVTQRSINSAKN